MATINTSSLSHDPSLVTTQKPVDLALIQQEILAQQLAIDALLTLLSLEPSTLPITANPDLTSLSPAPLLEKAQTPVDLTVIQQEVLAHQPAIDAMLALLLLASPSSPIAAKPNPSSLSLKLFQ